MPLTAAEKEQIYTYDADDPVDDGIACVSFYTELKEDGTVTLAEGFAQGFRPEEMQRRVEETVAESETQKETETAPTEEKQETTEQMDTK